MRVEIPFRNPTTGKIRHIKVGFSWTLFFFAPFGPLFMRKLNGLGVAYLVWILVNFLITQSSSLFAEIIFKYSGWAMLAADIWLGFKGNEMGAKKFLDDGWKIHRAGSERLEYAKQEWKSLSSALSKHFEQEVEEVIGPWKQTEKQEKIGLNVRPEILHWAFEKDMDYESLSQNYFCPSCGIKANDPSGNLYPLQPLEGGSGSIIPRTCKRCNSSLSPVSSIVSKEDFDGFCDHEREKQATSSSDDFLDKLMKLGQLRDQNVLTEEEFQAEKEKIMNERDQADTEGEK